MENKIKEEIFDEHELQVDMEKRKQRHLRKNGYIPPTIEEMREDHVKGDLPTIEKDYK